VKKMKAAAFRRQNEMAVIDAPEPTAGAGQVVLKVHDCGICGSDLHACQYGMGMPAGSIMGHEFCGEISEIGAGVSGFKVGERVADCRLCFAVNASAARVEWKSIATTSRGSDWDNCQARTPSLSPVLPPAYLNCPTTLVRATVH
jgi:threonine dehydrogenase-like Zn-dependent dehydrogenase